MMLCYCDKVFLNSKFCLKKKLYKVVDAFKNDVC